MKIPFLGNPLRPVLECLSFTLAFTFVGDSGGLSMRSPPFKLSTFPLLFALRLTRLAICVCSVISLTSPKRTPVEFSIAFSCCPLLSSNAFVMAGWNSIANYKVVDRRKGLLNVQLPTPKQGCQRALKHLLVTTLSKKAKRFPRVLPRSFLKSNQGNLHRCFPVSSGKLIHAKYTRNKATIATVLQQTMLLLSEIHFLLWHSKQCRLT